MRRSSLKQARVNAGAAARWLWLGVSLAGAWGCSGEADGEGAAPPAFPGSTAEPGAAGAPPEMQGAASDGSGPGASGAPSLEGQPANGGALPLAPDGGGTPSGEGPSGSPAAQQPEEELAALESVLVFSRTVGYRHDSIGVGVEAIRALGAAGGFAVEQTEDPARFTDEALAAFDVVVFLSTTADVLDEAGQGALERFIRAGGGWVGVHAAADTEYDWPWYGQLLGGGAYFQSHPAIQVAALEVEDAEHAATAHLPPTWQLEDEWYNFQANPREVVSVLLTLDEGSYSPGEGAMGADHPIAWFHEFDGGRAFYTALGHRSELYTDPSFTQHLLGGLRWAAGVAP